MERYLKWIKLFNIVAGVLLFTGTGFLAYSLITRQPELPDDLRLALPEAARIVHIGLLDDQLQVHVELPDGRHRLHLFDRRTGQPLDPITLTFETAPDTAAD